LIYCRDANSGLQSGKGSEAGVGFLTTLRVGVGLFVRLRMRKSNWITFASHS